jgi:riboflavin synthase
MFTGIIQAVGTLDGVVQRSGDRHVCVDTGKLDLSDVEIGDSIAVNGVCLTVTALASRAFEADLSAETLACTTFADRQVGDRLNLEKALSLGQRLGGHLVSGHVDGVGRVHTRDTHGQSVVLTFEAPQPLSRYIAEKGSICVDGVSLTVNHVEDTRFTVNLVPHTLTETTLDGLRVGATVNLEVDFIARYLERLLAGDRDRS